MTPKPILLPRTSEVPAGDFEQLVPDSRMSRLWEELQPMWGDMKVQFATYVDRAPYPGLPDERAVFVVVSPNPRTASGRPLIKTPALTGLDAWRLAEGEAWRYVGAGDPLKKVFTKLVREHLEKMQTLRTLKGANEL